MESYNKYHVLLLAFICLVIMSCGEDYSSPLKGIVVDNQTFETGTNNKTVSIGTKDISKCTITSSAAWCSATIQGSSVVINVQSNDTYEERQATITLTDPEDATTLSFNVVQKQNDAILIDNKSYTIPEDGGEVKIDVQSNVAYDVEIPSDADWLKRVSTRSLTSSSVVLRASKNESGDERTTKVTFVYRETGVKSQVTISQGFTPYLEIDKDEILLDVNGGTFSIAISTNTDIDIERGDSWVYIKDKSDEKGFSFVQNFYVDPSSNSRSTTITFRCSNTKWGLSKKVVVKQTVRFYIDDKNVTLEVGEKKTLNLVNETGKGVIWSSWNPKIATVDNKGKVTGISDGTAKISVKTIDGFQSDEITVTVEKKIDTNNISKEIALNELGTGIIYGEQFGSYIDFSITNKSKCNIEIKNMNAYSSSGNSFHNKSESIKLPSGSSVEYEVVKIQDHTVYLENYFLSNTFYLNIYYLNESNMQYYTKKVRFYKSSWLDTRYTIQDMSD